MGQGGAKRGGWRGFSVGVGVAIGFLVQWQICCRDGNLFPLTIIFRLHQTLENRENVLLQNKSNLKAF